MPDNAFQTAVVPNLDGIQKACNDMAQQGFEFMGFSKAPGGWVVLFKRRA